MYRTGCVARAVRWERWYLLLFDVDVKHFSVCACVFLHELETFDFQIKGSSKKGRQIYI